MTMEPIDILIKARVMLLREFPFLGYLSTRLELIEDDSDYMDKALSCTNGSWIRYHPKLAERPQSEIMFILSHETLHVGLGHLWRQGERDRSIWDLAINFAANWVLAEQGLKVPKDADYDHRFTGKAAEEIYASLLREQEQDQEKARGKARGKAGGGPGGKDITHNSHQSHQEGQGAGQKPGQEKRRQEAAQGPGKGLGQEPSQELSQDLGQGLNGDERTAEDLKGIWEGVLIEAAQVARQAGKLPSSLQQFIDATLNPKVPVWQLIRQWVKSTSSGGYTWVPPSKRHLWRKMVLPRPKGEMLEVAVALDGSGSIGDKEFAQFLGQMRAIAEEYPQHTMHIMAHDTRVYFQQSVTEADLLPKVHATRGGTDFRPVFVEVQKLLDQGEEVSGLVFFTDLYGTWPDTQPDFPVLWVATTDVAGPSWGTILRLQPEDL